MKRPVPTTAYKAIEGIVCYAITTSQPVLVYGPPGVGKTFALEDIAHKTPNAHYILFAKPSGSTNAALKLICDHLDIRGGRQHTGTMWRSLETYFEPRLRYRDDVLDPAPPALFFDEAQYLNLDLVHGILNLSMTYKVAIVLCGNRSLLKRTRSVDVDAFEQIESRLARRFMVPTPEDQDFESIAIDFDVSGKAAYRACVAFGRMKSIRALVRLLMDARALAGDGPLRLDEIKAAAAAAQLDAAALRALSQAT